MLSWFRALMPKEERFFDLFTRHAQVTLAAAEALRALLKGGDNVPQCCREITKRENEADEITREVLTALRRTFITPLDRGDIKDLITSMDDANVPIAGGTIIDRVSGYAVPNDRRSSCRFLMDAEPHGT